jgi:hypothetical protein
MAKSLPRLPSLPGRKGTKRLPAPPSPTRPVVYATGPRAFNRTKRQKVAGFGPPPPGFVTATTSASEWKWYAASWEAMKTKGDKRKGPFIGDPAGSWRFQKMWDGGRRMPGGSVIDFVYFLANGQTLAVRLQSWRFHLAAGSDVEAYDESQLRRLSEYHRVHDTYEQNWLGDPTDQAVVIACKNALAGIKEQNPLTSGTGRMVRS